MFKNNIYNFAKTQGIEVSHNSVDIDAILENSELNSVLTRDLLRDLSEEIVGSLKTVSFSTDLIAEYCSKLIEYRFIDKIFQLQKGKHVRWIRKQPPSTKYSVAPILTNGGIVMDIKFTNKGISILCKNKDRFIQYNFDDCLTYQKLSPDELMVVGCMKLVDS
jgi:hypothetical protein